ncbi:hypothetical protein ACFLQL_01340 [Verrucomicrobiota bacterium]
MKRIAKHRNIKINPTFSEFFLLSEAGQWGAADKIYKNMAKKSYYHASSEDQDPAIANALWELVHEIYWAHENLLKWNDLVRDMYIKDAFKSIPERSVLFTGTDVGRFIIPLYRDSVGRKYPIVISLNALLSPAYLAYLDDTKCCELILPSKTIWQSMSDGIINDSKSKCPTNIAGMSKLSEFIQVMEINNLLSKWIFMTNRTSFTFFVDEGFILEWMYPYLRPSGIFMVLNTEPFSKLTAKEIEDDFKYWNHRIEALLRLNEFISCKEARKTYSKLRTAIAGIYSYRGLVSESERALQQALMLYPESPDAVFRLFHLYLITLRFSDARKLIELSQNKLTSSQITSMTDNLRQYQALFSRQNELEALANNGMSFENALELIGIYCKLNKEDAFNGVVMAVLAKPIKSEGMDLLIQICDQYNKHDLLIEDCEKYVLLNKTDKNGWLNLAHAYLSNKDIEKTLMVLKRAKEINGKEMQEMIDKDKRFNKLYRGSIGGQE